MSIAGWFADQSIGRKIYGGFGLIILLAAAGMGMAVKGLNGSAAAFHDYREGVDDSLSAEKAGVRAAALSGALRAYVQRPSAERRQDVTTAVDALDRAARDMAQELSHEPDLAALATKMLALTAEYGAGFKALLDNQAAGDKITVQARQDAARLETGLAALSAAAAQDAEIKPVLTANEALRAFLTARIFGNQFLARPERALADRVLGDVDLLQQHVAQLEMMAMGGVWAGLLDGAKQAAADYRRGFALITDNVLTRQKLIDETLEKKSQAIVVLAQEISDGVAKRLAPLGPQADAQNRAALTAMLLALAGMVGAGLLLAAATGRGVARPAVRMTRAMSDLAAGHLETDIPAAERRDEIGAMAEALGVFRDALARNRAVEAEQRRAAELRAERAERVTRLTQDFDALVTQALGAVAAAAEQMRGSADDMFGAARSTGGQAAAVAAAAEEASANVQSVATSAEELAASILEIGRQVESAARAAAEATQAATQTSGVVGALADSARKIGQVVEVINDIAGQTNLLALNATIEAARAGDAGRGFAVVASEVKTLAAQTAQATEDVARQVQDIQAVTAQAVAAIDGIVAKVDGINHVQQSIAAAVEEQTAVTREISRGAHNAAAGAEHVTNAIGEVDDAAHRTGAAAEQVLVASRSLADQSTSLKHSVDGFLTAVRVA